MKLARSPARLAQLQELATCSQSQRSVQSSSRLLAERCPDWQAWDVAPPIFLQLVSFVSVAIGLLQVARCTL